MAGEKSARINSLNQSETEILHVLFKDPNFKVPELSRAINRSEGGIRTNLTAIFDKLEVPDNVPNKREFVIREYAEAYQYVFHREEWEAEHIKSVPDTPEMYIKPPDPIIEIPESATEGDTSDDLDLEGLIKKYEKQIQSLKNRNEKMSETIKILQLQIIELEKRLPDGAAIAFLISVALIAFFIGLQWEDKITLQTWWNNVIGK